MGRKRGNANRHLAGTNIDSFEQKGKTYYYYNMPDGSRQALAHGDEKTSIEVAMLLNQKFRNKDDIYARIANLQLEPVVENVTSDNPLMWEAIELFEKEWLPFQSYKKSSLIARKQKLKQWKTEWQYKKTGDITTFDFAQFTKGLARESARQHQVLGDQFFRWCSSSGLENQRPLVDIIKIKQQKRARKRHNWECYKAIYNASPEWLQIAQDAALYTLQRRGDLVHINFNDHISIKDRIIRVAQSKSENYDKPVSIDIKMGEELYKTVMNSQWSGINCPYLIHYRPKKITKEMRASKAHIFCVKEDYLTRAYSKVRDDLGVYDHIEKKLERPGLHSIRALGIWLYSKAGYDSSYIMALAGHADEEMTEHYIEGHEKPKPVAVEAGLSMKTLQLGGIDWETDLPSELKKLADAEE